jgi:DNA polymerase I-like protein with 3'-5' exonuclease and polymerase domains
VQTEPTPTPATPGTVGAGISRFKRIASKFIVPATTKCNGLRGAFDLEGNALLNKATVIHCDVIINLDTDEIFEYGPQQIPEALAHLARFDYLVGHNITGYDLPLLRRLHHWSPKAGCTIIDTLIASRLILPNVDDLDDTAAGMGDPKMGKLRGRYSIEAWGARLRIPKVGTEIEDWSKWTREMQARCVADTKITKALWQFLQPDGYPAEALALEHRVAQICERITADGVPFDVNAAERLRQQWTARRTELDAQLAQQFPGANLNSRRQIGALLEARGWVPEKRTEKTKQPKIDDELLESIPTLYPEFAGVSEFSILGRRLAALSKGASAWCKHVDADGRIHGGLVHIGTPHSRAKHLTPNLAQVPNPKRGKPFATECRSLFRTNDDRVFVCCDQSGLQDRGLGHYLHQFDGGAYAKTFLNGFDTHWKSAADLGLIPPGTALDKQNKVHVAIREGSKSFRYAFLYGVGLVKAGHIIGNTIRTVHAIDAGNGLQQQFFGNAAHPNENAFRRIGKDALNKFLRGTPGLARLRSKLDAFARKFGWLPGLDGRRVPVRALYTALNYIVTSSEAIICKRGLVNVFDELNEKFHYGWDGDVVVSLWTHDEIACCCRPEIADEIGAIMVRRAKEPGEFYKFKVPLDAEYTVGKSWAGKIGGDTEFVGHPDSGQPEITNHGPFVSVESETEPTPPVENPETSGNSENARAAPNEPDHDDISAPEEIVDMPWINVKTLFKTPPSAAVDGKAQSANSSGNDSGRDSNSGSRRTYPHGERRGGRLIATYLYRNHLGIPHTKVEKRISSTAKHAQYPQSFYVDGEWVRRKPPGWLKIPYRLSEMLAALTQASSTTIFIPEGEKDCETLVALGLVATTSSEGATNPKSKKGSNWTPELARWFFGVQRVFILEDNDEPGRNFGREKASALAGIVPDIRIVSFSDVPETEDVTYWLEHGHGKEELLARCESAPPCGAEGTLESLRAADVKMEAIDWLWPGRFALGKLGLLAGLPDEGKSTLLCYIAGRLTNPDLAWPNDEGRPPRCGTVVMLTSEDSPADTLVPRLVSAGANLDRIVIVQMVRDRNVKDGRERRRMFSLADDLELLRHKIETIGDVVAIEIDPVTAYLGTGKNGVDSFRDTDVRAVLGPLVQLAVDHRIAIIAIMHFNKKTDVTNALLRISNSLAFGGVARHVFAVTKDEANARRLMARAKNNIASEANNQTLAFHFETKQVGKDWRDDRPIEAPFIEFEPGYVDVTATEALSAVNENKAPGALDDAKDFLREILVAGGGRAPKADIEEAADAEKISNRTLWRAKKVLKVRAEKDRSTAEGKWYWILPDDDGDASAMI